MNAPDISGRPFAAGAKAGTVAACIACVLVLWAGMPDDGLLGDRLADSIVNDALAGTRGLDAPLFGYFPVQFPAPQGRIEQHVEAF